MDAPTGSGRACCGALRGDVPDNLYRKIADNLRRNGAQPWRHAPPGYYPGYDRQGRIFPQLAKAITGIWIICSVLVMFALWAIGIQVSLLSNSTLVIQRPSHEFRDLTQAQYNAAIGLVAEMVRSPQPGVRFRLAELVVGEATAVNERKVQILTRLLDRLSGYPILESDVILDQLFAEAQNNAYKLSVGQFYDIISLPKATFDFLIENNLYEFQKLLNSMKDLNIDLNKIDDISDNLTQRRQEISALKLKLKDKLKQQDREFVELERILTSDANAARKKQSGLSAYLRCRDALN